VKVSIANLSFNNKWWRNTCRGYTWII
jgi:hypothetical protein